MTRSNMCVECRWFEVDLDSRCRAVNWCSRTGVTLPAAVLMRRACDRFEPIRPTAHWGP